MCLAFSSEALTLGRARGAALVGQPLDMVVPVQMDAGEEASSLCFEADVFHADTRQEASRVRVVVEATEQAHTANVRVLSSAVIDEPVVTVYLRTGCGQKTSRRYVLLADLPSEIAAPVLASLVAPRSALPPAQGALLPDAAVPASASSGAANSVTAVKAKTVRVPTQTVRQEIANKRPELRSVVAAPKRTQSDEPKKPGRPAAQSRLKLDPLELLSDRVGNLDADMTFPPSEDALRNLEKVQALEANMKALLALAAKNEASLADLKTRLQKAESERFPGGVIYGLIALVLACLAALALLWNRQRRVLAGSDDWWGASAMPAAAVPEPEPGPSPAPLAVHTARDEGPVPTQTRSAALSGGMADSGPSTELGVSLMEMSDSAFDDLMKSGVVPAAKRKQHAPLAAAVLPSAAPVLNLNSEATSDIRQQAEFFVSLGQTDRAVRILTKQIAESDVPNPLVYLDLLSLFHSLSLKPDFQLLREDFNLLFNATVPEFAVFKNEGKGLESYPDVLSRITAFWSTSTILEVLEACILQNPRLAKMPVFDLAAFRDLLLLHDLVQRLVHDADLAPNRQTDLSVHETLPPPMLDLDLDLGLFESDTKGFAPHPAAAEEVDVPLLMPGDHEFAAAGAGARQSLDADPMLSFELLEADKRP